MMRSAQPAQKLIRSVEGAETRQRASPQPDPGGGRPVAAGPGARGKDRNSVAARSGTCLQNSRRHRIGRRIMGKKLTKRPCWAVAVAFAALALVLTGLLRWRAAFPHGPSHACSKQLGLALRLHAADHGGWFPCGEAMPEGSMGLIGTVGPDRSCVSRGKTLGARACRAGSGCGRAGPGQLRLALRGGAARR